MSRQKQGKKNKPARPPAQAATGEVRGSRGAWLGVAVVAIAGAGAGAWYLVGGGGSEAAVVPAEVPHVELSDMQPRVAEVVGLARSAVVASPRSAAVWSHFAKVCDVHGLHDAAITAYRQAATLAPSDARWPYLLATLLERVQQDSSESLALFERAAAMEPSYPPIHFRIGEVLSRQGRLASACAAYEKALSMDPQMTIARRSLGQALLTLGKAEEAAAALEAVQREAPNDGPTHAAMSKLLLRQGAREAARRESELARRFADQLAVTDPIQFAVTQLGVSASIAYERAKQAIRQRDFASAARDLEIAIEHMSDNAYVHLRLAIAYMETGRSTEAQAHYEQAMGLRNKLAAESSADAEECIALDSNISAFRRTYFRMNETMQAHADRAMRLAHSGEVEAALAAFEAAAAIGPVDARTHVNWGSALREAGRTDAAIEHYRQATALDPGYATAWHHLGLELERRGETEQAKAHYRRAVAIDPRHGAAERLVKLDAKKP